MRTPMLPVTVEALAKMRVPAMATITPPEAAVLPMDTATGRVAASPFRAVYNSCDAAAPPPGESTRSSTPLMRGLSEILRIQSSCEPMSRMGPETDTTAMPSSPKVSSSLATATARSSSITSNRMPRRYSQGCRLRNGRCSQYFQTGSGMRASGQLPAQGAAGSAVKEKVSSAGFMAAA